MGDTVVQLRLDGPTRARELEAVVDTGATLSKIPRSVAVELGLRSWGGVKVTLGDGRTVDRDVCTAPLELSGVRGEVPVSLGDEGERPIVGYTTLEILGLKVNPVTGKLERTTLLEL